LFVTLGGEVGGGELEPVDAVIGVFCKAGVEVVRTDGVDVNLGGGIDGDLPALLSEERDGMSHEFDDRNVPLGGRISGN